MNFNGAFTGSSPQGTYLDSEDNPDLFNRLMKVAVIALVTSLVVIGCRTVEERRASPTTYPPLPVPLVEFVKSPTDGTYSLPESLASIYTGFDLKVMTVSGGKIILSSLDDVGQTNGPGLIEFKSSLPPAQALQEIGAGASEEQIGKVFGRPTFVIPPSFRVPQEIEGRSKVVAYMWFTVSPTSQITFMRLTLAYTRANVGPWKIEHLRWVTWGERKMSSNLLQQSTPGERYSSNLASAVERRWAFR